MPSHELVSSFAGTRGGFRAGRSSCFRGGGRNGGRTRVQCQICSKFGHDAKVCDHRLSAKPQQSYKWRKSAPYPPSQHQFMSPWAHVPPSVTPNN